MIIRESPMLSAVVTKPVKRVKKQPETLVTEMID